DAEWRRRLSEQTDLAVGHRQFAWGRQPSIRRRVPGTGAAVPALAILDPSRGVLAHFEHPLDYRRLCARATDRSSPRDSRVRCSTADCGPTSMPARWSAEAGTGSARVLNLHNAGKALRHRVLRVRSSGRLSELLFAELLRLSEIMHTMSMCFTMLV